LIDRFVTRQGLRLHVVDHEGEGPALLFLHGGTAHAHWWDFVVQAIGPGVRAFAADLRGHGDSSSASDGAYRVRDYVEDVAFVIAELGLERPIVIGHSLGSFVALDFAVEHPGAASGIVVADGRASFGAAGARYLRLLGMFGSAQYPSLEEAIERFRPLPKETIALPDALAHVIRHGVKREGDGWTTKFDRAALTGLDVFDLRARLAEIECPVLFIRGEHSTVVSKSAAARLAAACRSGRVVELPGCHHHVLIDRPDLLGAEIRAFVREVRSAG
jgi:pimeloyl-ACP methyl ester carboxylesterase